MRLLRLAALLALLALPASAQETASVAGRVVLSVEGVSLADLGQTVVFLESSGTAPPPPPRDRLAVRQRNARFAPDFLAIAAGQTVEMPNDDALFHNVFSFSKPNDFDLGLYAAGDSRKVTFRHGGVVKIYCSIHESMSATIFVSPSPFFAVVAPSGEFAIQGAPLGRGRLRVWNEKLPQAGRDVVLQAGANPRVEIPLALGTR
jgi:plastocyanin